MLIRWCSQSWNFVVRTDEEGQPRQQISQLEDIEQGELCSCGSREAKQLSSVPSFTYVIAAALYNVYKIDENFINDFRVLGEGKVFSDYIDWVGQFEQNARMGFAIIGETIDKIA